MVIGIGETILDIIFKNDKPEAAFPGGSTFNAMISLGRTGLPCTMITDTGDDHVGEIICNYLADNGVDTSYVHHHANSKSHISLAFLDDNNDANYQFYKDHANVCIGNNVPEISSDDVILFGSFFAINPVIRKEVRGFLKKAYESGAILYYDINFRASHINDIPDVIDNITENMKMATVVRGSLEDFQYLYGLTSADEIYHKHVSPFCSNFICTNGAKSVEVFTPEFKMSILPKPIETVSTVGAGDSFNAGFIYQIIKDGISRNTLLGLDRNGWSRLIDMGQLFSSHVCQSIYNSISKEFADRLKND